MRVNELISSFDIATNNEEKSILNNMSGAEPLASFSERDQVIIQGLIRKSLISKVQNNSTTLVVKNDLD